MDSMFYTLLARSFAGGGGGGGGGTTDFNDLSNKPKVNNTTLVGNKTSSDLGLQPAINASNKLSADLIAETDSKKFNVQADWEQIVSTAPDFIKNKPVLGTAAATDASAYATAAQGSKADTAIQGIKVNGSTASPDSNKVVSITVPTSAADVSALPNTTKYAAALSLTINSSTFVMTGQLKDQNGDNLGTAQTIDLPLESVVVGGSYNSQTKKVVLALQNGNTIEFSVADLVSGLQTELSASNKLNPTYISYDSTHRAVSDAEKATWNGKQSALTTEQLDAVNSGITSVDVAQIETNQNYGVKNLSPYNSGTAPVSDGVIWNNLPIDLAAGTYTVSFSTNSTGSALVLLAADGATEVLRKTYSTTTVKDTFTISAAAKYIRLYVGTSKTVSDFMIRSFGDDTFVPYALSNAKLTQSVAPIPSLVDAGAKNHLNNTLSSGTTPFGNISYTVNKDKSITIKGGTATTGNADIVIPFSVSTSGTYVLTGGAAGGGSDTYKAQIALYPSMANVVGLFDNTYAVTELSTGTDYAFRFRVYNGQIVPDCTIYPMICTKADWDISQSYQPYAMDNAELTQSVEPIPRLVDAGAKNDLEFDAIGTTTTYGTTYESNGVKFTLNADNTVTFERISTSSSVANCLLILNGARLDVSSYCDGNHILSGCPSGGASNTYEIMATVSGGAYTKRDYGTGVILDSASGIEPYIQLTVRSGFTGTATFKPMICSKADWDISQTYQPYAMGNAELTQYVEPIPRLVDAGAKNKLLIGSPTSIPAGLTCVRNSDGTYTVSGTLATANSISFNISAIEGNLVLSGCPEGGGNDTYLLRITKSGSQVVGSVDTGNGSDVFTMSGTGYALGIRFAAGTYTNVIFSPMICTKADWDISQEYSPYALSNPELTASAIEVVDNGAKNKLPITVSSQVVGEAVFTVNADNSISVYTTATTTALRSITLVQATDNLYVYSTDIVSGVPSTDKDVVIQFGIGTSGNIKNVEPSVGYIAAGASGYMRYMQLIIRSGVSIPQTKPLIFKPMICTKAAWDTSQSYQPYRPSYQELYEMVKALQAQLSNQ